MRCAMPSTPRPRADYLGRDLTADSGPLGTTDYRIMLEAVPLGSGAFVHFRYAYRPSLVSSVAIASYLATFGSGKVGFSVVDEKRDGKPVLVSGVRVIVERNAMRYYLAIQAFPESLNAPETQRSEQRFQRWFDLTERYPAQLHELERADYLHHKRRELAQQLERQQTLDAAAFTRGFSVAVVLYNPVSCPEPQRYCPSSSLAHISQLHAALRARWLRRDRRGFGAQGARAVEDLAAGRGGRRIQLPVGFSRSHQQPRIAARGGVAQPADAGDRVL